MSFLFRDRAKRRHPFGLRWQAERATALASGSARWMELRESLVKSGWAASQSADDAPLCRRSPYTVARSSAARPPTAIRFVLFTLAVFFLAGCTSRTPPPPVPIAIERARQSAETAARLSRAQNWPAAAGEWQRAADLFALLNDRASEAVAWHNLGQAQRELGDLEGAGKSLQQAAAINHRLQRDEEWWRNQLAWLQLEALADSDALPKRLAELRAGVEKLKAPELRAQFWNESGLAEIQQRNWSSAAAAFDRARAEFETANHPAGIAAVVANRARLAEAQPDFAAALNHWREALSRYEELAEPHGIADSLAGLGRASVGAGQLAEAEEYLRRASRNYRTLNAPKLLAATLELLAKTLDAQGKAEAAKAIRDELP